MKTLARLQRTVFVDRERRLSVGTTATEIERRLAQGDAIVLFAEGTSNDGNQVLPFRSALIAAAGIGQRRKAGVENGAPSPPVEVRTLSLAYTHLHGIALGRYQRPQIAWYGDMRLGGHVWALLRNGPLDVHVRIGDPVALSGLPDRKALARHGEDEVRRTVAALLRQGGAG